MLFASGAPATIQRVSAAGGVVSPVTALDTSRQENGHFSPSFLPDGHHFVVPRAECEAGEQRDIRGLPGGSKKRKLLLHAISTVRYVLPGYLLFHRAGTLMAQPFDASRLELNGEAVPIAERGQFSPRLF